MVPRERIGFNDLVLDPDGAIRRGLLFVPDAQQPQGGFYAFSLRLVLAYLGESRTQDQGSAVEESVESIAPQAANPLFQVDPNKALVLKGQRFERLEPHSGGYSNIDTGGYQVLLDFHSRQSVVQRVTFQEVLTNQVPASLIHDRIVLIGTTAPSLKDGFRTPYSSGESEDFLLPGVLVHAQIANSLLEALMENHHLLGYWPEIWEFVWIGLWIGAMGILSWWVRRPLVSTIVFLLAGFGLVMITYGLFLSNVWVPLVSPLVGGTIVSASIVGYRAYEFQQQQQIVMRLLGQNTSPEIAETLWNSRDRLLKSGKLPGQRLTATIMFADIRNFSTTAELLSPEALMDWLNVCLEPVTQEIQQHHGIVNKFTGDGFMAVFGLPMARVPAEISQDAQQAVACALAIAGHLRTLNAAWKPQDLPLMQMRIGIFTGPVTAGSLGGKDRMEYGIIGDTVNIASRLESCAKERHVGTCRVLIGQETYDCLDGRFKVEDWGPMALKGKAQMVNVYRVIDPNDPEEAIDLVARHA
jgi:class 3 adenylate cyclase